MQELKCFAIDGRLQITMTKNPDKYPIVYEKYSVACGLQKKGSLTEEAPMYPVISDLI